MKAMLSSHFHFCRLTHKEFQHSNHTRRLLQPEQFGILFCMNKKHFAQIIRTCYSTSRSNRIPLFPVAIKQAVIAPTFIAKKSAAAMTYWVAVSWTNRMRIVPIAAPTKNIRHISTNTIMTVSMRFCTKRSCNGKFPPSDMNIEKTCGGANHDLCAGKNWF